MTIKIKFLLWLLGVANGLADWASFKLYGTPWAEDWDPRRQEHEVPIVGEPDRWTSEER